MIRDPKEVWNETYYAMLEEGFSESAAQAAADDARTGLIDRMLDAADDARYERKLWGNQ